jgi:hypothetical protein
MNMYDGFYKQENAEGLTMWQQGIDNAWKTIGQQSSDYWSQTNFDEGVRQFDQTFNATYTSDGNGGYVKKGTGGGGSGGGAGGSGKLSNGASITSMSTYKQKALAAYNEGGDDALDTYVDSLGLDETEKAEIGMYVYGGKDADGNEVEGNGKLPLYMQTFTKTTDTFNWLWGVDNNDEVTDQNGKKWKLSELKKQLKSDGVDSKIIDKILDDLTGLGKNKTYTYSKN